MIIIKSPSFAKVLLELLVEESKKDDKLCEEARVRHALAQPNARRVNWLANDPKCFKHIMENESAFWISQECADRSAVDVLLALEKEGLGIMEQPANDNPTLEEQEKIRYEDARIRDAADTALDGIARFGMLTGCSTMEEAEVALLEYRKKWRAA